MALLGDDQGPPQLPVLSKTSSLKKMHDFEPVIVRIDGMTTQR
jgi:hypothetical protein